MSENTPTLMIIAGELSGDLHGSDLVASLKALKPDLRVIGVGGERMAKAGVELLFHIKEMALVGIVEVPGKLAFFLNVYRTLVREMTRQATSALIVIDFPDFNLRLASAAKKRGIPVIYYISPQIWAWRGWRIRQIERVVRKMLVIFPFEVPLYEKTGVDVEFVGHPLIDLVKPSLTKVEACQRYTLSPDRPIVGLVPGSRKSEIHFLLPPMVEAAKTIHEEMPETQFVLPLAETLDEADVAEVLEQSGLNVKVVKGETYDLMAISDFLLVTSGTATLEAGLLGVPMVIVYKSHPLNILIAKALTTIPHAGLVNILAGREIVPELIQSQVTPERMAEIALKALRDSAYREEITTQLKEIREMLDEGGASKKAALAILRLLFPEWNSV
ncbi:MAG: lipid-A-disaccharide synthase [Candidatus Tectomicrobia bacterium]|nr:lipid-A-disaccharide synthase [Candidatus Tectomicrobia bacterium]